MVVDKPSGPTSEAVAAALGRRLVHRIDRLTSGLLMLADDARTVTRLQRALREGQVERRYRFLANGVLRPSRLESNLVRNRGDGLRGSGAGGKLSVAEVYDCEVLGEGRATLCSARLVTGRTHQLRIQLAEAGHPLVGEPVYVRDALASRTPLLAAARLMLHARSLRFMHPDTHQAVEATSPLPADFTVMFLPDVAIDQVQAPPCALVPRPSGQEVT